MKIFLTIFGWICAIILLVWVFAWLIGYSAIVIGIYLIIGLPIAALIFLMILVALVLKIFDRRKNTYV